MMAASANQLTGSYMMAILAFNELTKVFYMNIVFSSQLLYCPLTWMQPAMTNDTAFVFEEILMKSNAFLIQYRNI